MSAKDRERGERQRARTLLRALRLLLARDGATLNMAMESGISKSSWLASVRRLEELDAAKRIGRGNPHMHGPGPSALQVRRELEAASVRRTPPSMTRPAAQPQRRAPDSRTDRAAERPDDGDRWWFVVDPGDGLLHAARRMPWVGLETACNRPVQLGRPGKRGRPWLLGEPGEVASCPACVRHILAVQAWEDAGGAELLAEMERSR